MPQTLPCITKLGATSSELSSTILGPGLDILIRPLDGRCRRCRLYAMPTTFLAPGEVALSESDSFLTELGVNPRISWVSDQSLFSEPVLGVAVDTVETAADKPDFVVEANLSPYTLLG